MESLILTFRSRVDSMLATWPPSYGLMAIQKSMACVRLLKFTRTFFQVG